MKVCIDVYSDGRKLRHHVLNEGEHLVGSQGGDIALSYPTVSRRHGTIIVGTESISFLDLGSRNGTLLEDQGNELELKPDQTAVWPSGAKIRIGPFALKWRQASSDAEFHVTRETELNRIAAVYSRLLVETPQLARERLYETLEEQPNRDALLERIYREFHGHGPVHDWIDSPACREILINAHNEIYVDVGDGLIRADSSFLSRESFEAWATRTAHAAGRRLDLHHPICEATLENGARFHAVMSPVSARGLAVAIRRFGSAPLTESAALESAWISQEALGVLKKAILSKRNIVISGGTSTGKTSLLNFLCQYLPQHERVVTVEDTVELSPPVHNLVQLQARNANSDGVGEVSLRELVQCALRMRPDRIIVGECRGPEVLDMLQALNTGHPGSITTIHANSDTEALERLELLALLGAPNLSVDCIRRWIHSSVELVVQVARSASGQRFVKSIAARTDEGSLERLYAFELPDPHHEMG